MNGSETADDSEQVALLRPGPPPVRATRPGRSTRPAGSAKDTGTGSARPPAAELPVARVAVDVPLPHLDRPLDYLVPADLAETARPGVRVRVRFAGRLVDGFVLDRVAGTDHGGRLAALHKVVSPEPVLTPETASLARAVADRYAGAMADVLRLAVPPRHARAESRASLHPSDPPPAPDAGSWERYGTGPALVRALARGEAPRAVWTALPGAGWPEEIARLVAATLSSDRGALVILPDRRDVAQVDAATRALLGDDQHLVLAADLGPAERYARWLAVRRGGVRAVVGTRAAMFAPVARLGLALVWDDGDDLHAEPHAPYPHVREVLCLRALHEDAALVVGGLARTAEGAALVRSGWARSVAAARTEVRRAAPAVRVAGEDGDLGRDEAARAARLPTVAWRAARDGLERGPVLVQVPRAGYLPSLTCAGCRAAARCAACHGPLATADRGAALACGWCAAVATDWRCPQCGGHATRARVVGAGRTADELGRAFPRVMVRTSGGRTVLDTVGPEPALVVATPGAEPVAEGGYAAAVLLDGWALLSRPDLRAAEEALRRWLTAAALVRPAGRQGQVIVLAESSSAAAQALVRWDPATFADRELADRRASRLPPAASMASLAGAAEPLRRFLEVARLPEPVEVLGPVAVPGKAVGVPGDDDVQRMLVRVPRSRARDLAAALRAAAGVRSAHKEPGAVRVQVDPLEVA